MMGMLFGGAKTPAPPPPPPPPSPPSVSSPGVANAQSAEQAMAQAAAGGGFAGTLLTGGQGSASPTTAAKNLLGQ